MLQGLSDEALYTLTTFFERNTFNEGDYVIEEGTEGDHFYVVHAGSVSVTQFSSSLNSSVELEILGSGQYFGEMALLRRVPRTATVQVTSKTAELLVMHREAFQTFMAPFEQQLQEEMAMREASTSSKKADLHGDDKMIAESFPSLMQTQGFAGSGRSRNESMAIAIEKKQGEEGGVNGVKECGAYDIFHTNAVSYSSSQLTWIKLYLRTLRSRELWEPERSERW